MLLKKFFDLAQGADTGFRVGWGAKDFIARESRGNLLAPHPKFAKRWGAKFSLLFCNQDN